MPTSVRQSSPVIASSQPDTLPSQATMAARSAAIFRNIDAVEHELSTLPDPIISDAKLQSLGFTRGPSLGDSEEPTDTRNLFFAPYPNERIEDLCTGIVNQFMSGDTEYLNYCKQEHHCGACPNFIYTRISQLLSFAEYRRLAGWRRTTSICAKDPDHRRTPIYCGHRAHPALYPDHSSPEWRLAQAAFVPGKPHVRIIVEDTTIAQNHEVLRSEVVCAIRAIQHQMKCSRYAESIVPVLIFSIGHTDVGRITQCHVDRASGKIVLRQMRLLNFVPASGDQLDRGIDDWFELANLFLWLEATPMGTTQVATENPFCPE